MDTSSIGTAVMSVLDSNAGFAVTWAGVFGFFLFLASRINPFQEAWRRYEGTIITAIRLAEKQIPDGVSNAGLAKLDAALRFVLDAYAEANGGKAPSASLIEQIKQGIQIKHNELDRSRALTQEK